MNEKKRIHKSDVRTQIMKFHFPVASGCGSRKSRISPADSFPSARIPGYSRVSVLAFEAVISHYNDPTSGRAGVTWKKRTKITT